MGRFAPVLHALRLVFLNYLEVKVLAESDCLEMVLVEGWANYS